MLIPMSDSNTSQLASPVKKGNRELWLDILRGVAMLLVVYSHILVYSGAGVPGSALNAIFISTRMPLFFFISGFFMYSVDYDFALATHRLRNRLLKQLYPTIIFFVLFVLLCRNGKFNHLHHTAKDGYWFTYVSVLYFITLLPMLVTFSRLKIGARGRIVTFLILMLGSYILQNLADATGFFSTYTAGYLSYLHYISYLRFLLAGCIFRILWNRFGAELLRGNLAIAAAVDFILFFDVAGDARFVTACCGIYCLMYASYKLTGLFGNKRPMKWLAYIGSMTLEIYLLHYIILNFTVKKVEYVCDIVKNSANRPWEFLLMGGIAVVTVLICLLLTALLKRLKLYGLFFGGKLPFKISFKRKSNVKLAG